MAFNDIDLATIDEGTSAKVTSDLNDNFVALKTAGENADTEIATNANNISAIGGRVTAIENGTKLGIKSITYGTGSSTHVNWQYRIITDKDDKKYAECFGRFSYTLNNDVAIDGILTTTGSSIAVGNYPVTFMSGTTPVFYVTPMFGSGTGGIIPICYAVTTAGTRTTPPQIKPMFNFTTPQGEGHTIYASLYAYGRIQ